MSSIITKNKRAGRRASVSSLKPTLHRHTPDRHATVVKNARTTHVLVPIDEYQRLKELEDVRALEAKLEDPNTEWVDAEVFARRYVVDQIIEAREKAGLTQKQLAERLKMPQSQISRIERNPDRTTVRTLKKIAAALKVDVRSLL